MHPPTGYNASYSTTLRVGAGKMRKTLLEYAMRCAAGPGISQVPRYCGDRGGLVAENFAAEKVTYHFLRG
jgi:hypothetical protein